MRKHTVIIDTGCANVSSVRFAVERLGYQATLSRDPDVVLGADKLFFARRRHSQRSDEKPHRARLSRFS
jgi:Glutamine amidotransferase